MVKDGQDLHYKPANLLKVREGGAGPFMLMPLINSTCI